MSEGAFSYVADHVRLWGNTNIFSQLFKTNDDVS